jgi:hypothetical protein
MILNPFLLTKFISDKSQNFENVWDIFPPPWFRACFVLWVPIMLGEAYKENKANEP